MENVYGIDRRWSPTGSVRKGSVRKGCVREFTLIGLFVSAFALGVAAAPPLYLVKDGKPVATVVRPRGEPPVAPEKTVDAEGKSTAEYEVAHAAYRRRRNDHYRNVLMPSGRLQQVVQKLTGARLRIVADGAAVDGAAVHVGLTDTVKRLGLPLASRFGQTTVVKRVGGILVLAGGPNGGTAAAVTDFLEREFGVRRYMPGPLGWVLPQTRTLAVGDVDRRETPDYPSRDFSGIGEAQGVPGGYEWSRWNRAKHGPLHIVHNTSRGRIGRNVRVTSP